MFSFGTIGAYKQVRNNPRGKAAKELKNGLAVLVDEANESVDVPADATAAKGDNLYVAYNIIDKPEVRNSDDFVIEAGEYVRAFLLADLKELPVLLGEDVVDGYADVAKGDVLVAQDATGKWVKADGTTIIADEYAVKLEVLEKNGFGGNGLKAIVRA